MQDVYGWNALQWQGWARGSINVQGNETKVLALHTDYVLEYWIDDVHYFGGDFYAFRRAPVTLRLEPGVHTVDVRLIRDVRAMGGVGAPDITIKLALKEVVGDLQSASSDSDAMVLLADVINGYDGKLASTAASSTLCNHGAEDVFVTGIEAMPSMCFSELFSKFPIKLVPGQTRPIAFKLECVPPIAAGPPYYGEYWVDFKYHTGGSDEEKTLTLFDWPIHFRETHEPHKITYMHPGGMVSYAILRPPSPSADCSRYQNNPLPVLLAFHGAGLEADSEQVRHGLDAVPDLCAWVLFPTGVTPWSGDDWHIWGFADVEAAIAAISDWIQRNDWRGPGVDVNRWFVMGHSNGGQGAWYALTNHPDRVIAAASLSGYSSIQNYVPYTFWHPTDPARTAVVQAALNSYKHELLLDNANGIPIYQQHGELDDNVPPYHSRLINSLLHQVGVESQYMEIPGMPHYWDGVMTTPALTDFFHKHLDASFEQGVDEGLKSFSIVTASPGDTRGKAGFRITHLQDPSRLGRISLSIDPKTQSCVAQVDVNVLAFEIYQNNGCTRYNINGQTVSLDDLSSRPSTFLSTGNDGFRLVPSRPQTPTDPGDPTLPPRHNHQLGPADSILRTNGPFTIINHSPNPSTSHFALQISHNLAQYYYADTLISETYPSKSSNPNNSDPTQKPGTIISLSLGRDLPPLIPKTPSPTIQVSATGITITTPDPSKNCTREYHYASQPGSGLAALFLRPHANDSESLELVLWAPRAEDLALVARLVPLLTGTGVPEFVVLDGQAGWRGSGGVRALGWFDSFWGVVERGSVFT